MGSIPVGDSDFFSVPPSCYVDYFIFITLSPSLKKSPSFISLSFTTTTSTLLFQAVCRTRAIHELSLMASPSMSSGGSVDRGPARCLGGHGIWFPSTTQNFFFVPRSSHVDYFIFISLSTSLKKKFTITYFFFYQKHLLYPQNGDSVFRLIFTGKYENGTLS